MKVYDTLSKQEVELEASPFKMYVCGPTVYDHSHIGHGRIYVVFDVLRRVLEDEDRRVQHVMNITDIDDKLIRKAEELGTTVSTLATKMFISFLDDMKRLNVKMPHVLPFATAHIPDIISIIRRLEQKGYTYTSDDGVYFRVKRFPEYGKLSGQRLDDLKAGARVEPGNKEEPWDFSLWKFKKPGEPSWDSPWGEGRPGWHIECSAMIHRHLGEPIDLHGGGQDLIFPHHENEIAQSEAAFGVPLSKAWLHVGLLRIKGEKMSKSLGNHLILKDAFRRWGPMVLRVFYLLHNPRTPIDGIDDMDEAIAIWKRLERMFAVEGPFREEDYEAVKEPLTRMDTRKAIYELAERSRRGYGKWAQKAMDLLGLRLYKNEREEKMARLLLEVRDTFRRERRYDLSDSIRERLNSWGIEILDRDNGSEVVIHDIDNP